MVTPKPTTRYPRRGERIAPYTLREFLMEPLPREVCRQYGVANKKLCDLDETAWEWFPPDVVDRLAQLVVERVAASHVRKAFRHCHFPRPAAGLRVASLRLESRTRRCLAQEGFDRHPERLGDHTLGEIMSIRAFGPRCLVDLLSALESPRHDGRAQTTAQTTEDDKVQLSEELTVAARRLAALPEAEAVRSEDPRFARLMHAVDVEAQTAQGLARQLLARTQDPPDAAYAAQAVRQLCERVEGLPGQTLEEELIQIFASTSNERNGEIVIGYYGWKDGRHHTLTEIGDRFGITRERIRQVCAKLTRKPRGLSTILAPVMDRALAFIHSRLPGPAAEIEAELVRRGWTSIGMPLENVATGARLLGRTADFRVVEVDPEQVNGPRLAVRSSHVNAVLAIVDSAKKDVYFHGLATIEEIARVAAVKFPGSAGRELVAETLQLVGGFAWLDKKAGWFRVKGIGKHGLPKTIDKVLAVAGEVTVAQLRTAMARNRRLWKEPPPENVLLEFCRHLGGVRIEGHRVIADPPRDWRQCLTGVELELVEVLTKHGPIMERGEMEDICVGAGMNRFSFHAFVSWSPVIVQLGHSVYGLLGTEVPKRKIEALSKARRASRMARRVLDGHGWTEDGKVWLSYRLSKAASTYAVITVPAALKNEVQGRFALLGPDGTEIGTLATKEGRAWGLGAFLRQQGARIDDFIVLTLDLKQRTAAVSWRKEE
jgi:hypothetical protein